MNDFHEEQGGSKVAQEPQAACYQRELAAAISRFLPAQFFSRWPVHGNAVWTPQRLAWAACLMSWSLERSLTERLEGGGVWLAALFPRWRGGLSFGAFGRAWVRETPRMVEALRRQLRKPLQGGRLERHRVFGWTVMAVDGSRFEAPRTPANEATLGCAGREKTTTQIYQTTLQHVGTSLLWDFRLGPGTDSERRHLEEMLPDFPKKTLLVADAGFISYDLCRALENAGHAWLLRVGGNTQLLQELGFPGETCGQTVFLWPLSRQAEPPIVLRLLRLCEAHREPVYLVTNLAATALSDAAAGRIYRLRWGVETYYRTVKQTLARQRLLSRTPAAALAEQTWLVIGVWLLQLMTADALSAANRSPRRWSAAQACREVRRTLQSWPSRRPREPLSDRLGRAQLDDYRRTKPKQTRRGVQKKREHPPGPPKIRKATERERQRAQQFRRPP